MYVCMYYVCMYEKVATVTVSIEETVSLGQGERGPDRDSYFPKINWSYCFEKIPLSCIFKVRYVNEVYFLKARDVILTQCTVGVYGEEIDCAF